MSFLLDTNVLSEVRKPRIDANVKTWISSVAATDLYLSVLTLGEIRRGIEGLRRRDPVQANVYEEWLTILGRDYSDRILPITIEIAEEWGKMGVREAAPAIDGLIAATAKSHNLVLVTRNTSDIENTGVEFINPFENPTDH